MSTIHVILTRETILATAVTTLHYRSANTSLFPVKWSIQNWKKSARSSTSVFFCNATRFGAVAFANGKLLFVQHFTTGDPSLPANASWRYRLVNESRKHGSRIGEHCRSWFSTPYRSVHYFWQYLINVFLSGTVASHRQPGWMVF